MRQFRTLAAAAVLASMSIAGPIAHAEDDGEDVESIVYAQRNIVLATGLVRPEGMLSFTRISGIDDTFIRLDARAAWSPIKNLEVGALAVPLALSPDVEYGNPRLYARYRVLEGAFEIAPELGFEFNKSNVLTVGVPMRAKLNPAAYIEFAPFLVVDFPGSDDPDGTETQVGFALPVEIAISVMRQLYISFHTGLNLPDFDFDLASIPLMLEVGYSLPSGADTAWIDIYLGFGFPGFLNLGPGDALNTDIWTAGLGARFHFGLE